MPMSTAASSEKPRFHGKKRPPMVSVDGTTVSFARQLSLARVVRLAGVALAVVREADLLLDERADALVGEEGLGAEEESKWSTRFTPRP